MDDKFLYIILQLTLLKYIFVPKQSFDSFNIGFRRVRCIFIYAHTYKVEIPWLPSLTCLHHAKSSQVV